MAGRPPKESIDYAGWDVNVFDSDPRIDKLLDAQGCAGFVIYFYLCQKAYGSYGYYYSWCYDDAATTARKIGGGVGAKTVEETVRYCLQIGLFNKGLFDRWNILTSRRIQKNYRQVAINRTGNRAVIRDYWLLSEQESTGFIFHASENNYDPPKLNYDPPKLNYDPQKERKGKESKGKESKENLPVTAGAATPKIFGPDSIEHKSTVYLVKKILERDPGAKVPKTEDDIQKWCVHIDRILRLDKRPPEQLRDVLKFAVTNSFWSSNIQSTKGLRDKFDKLYANMQRNKDGGNSASVNRSISYEDWTNKQEKDVVITYDQTGV